MKQFYFVTAFMIIIFLFQPSTFLYADRIAFGSCNNFEREGTWDQITQFKPEKLLLLGDNIYADKKIRGVQFVPATIDEIRYNYQGLLVDPSFARLVSEVKGWGNIVATWDDHDYGINNGDKTYEHRSESKDLFFDSMQVPLDSAQRAHAGVYSSKTFTMALNSKQKHSPATDGLQSSNANPNATSGVNASSSSGRGFIYKVVMLDVRYNKDPPSMWSDKQGDFLGEEQWRWLEAELADPEPDLVLLGSGIQVLPTDKIVQEAWADFPAARRRLLRAVMNTKAANVVLLSGDIHSAEINKMRCRRSDGSGHKKAAAVSSAAGARITDEPLERDDHVSGDDRDSSSDTRYDPIDNTRSGSATDSSRAKPDSSSDSRDDDAEDSRVIWELTSSGLTHTFTHRGFFKEDSSKAQTEPFRRRRTRVRRKTGPSDCTKATDESARVDLGGGSTDDAKVCDQKLSDLSSSPSSLLAPEIYETGWLTSLIYSIKQVSLPPSVHSPIA
jgi:hypothetical protein